METLAELTERYAEWCEAHNVTDKISADELIVSDRWELDYEERQWLRLFIERWEFAQEFEGSKFSDVLEAFLAYRATKPDESDGYTDKAWYRRGARLAKALDSFFTKET